MGLAKAGYSLSSPHRKGVQMPDVSLAMRAFRSQVAAVASVAKPSAPAGNSPVPTRQHRVFKGKYTNADSVLYCT